MRLTGLLVTMVLVAACGSAAQPAGTTQPGATTPLGATAAAGQTSAPATPAAGGGGGASLYEKAKAVKHICDILPTDLIPGIIDVPTPPQEEQFPPTCSVFGTKTAMAIWFDIAVALSDPPAGAKPIAGLGTGVRRTPDGDERHPVRRPQP